MHVRNTVRVLLPILCAPLLGVALHAQEDAKKPPSPADESMAPAKEVKRFDKLLGYWEGSGTMQPGADGESAPWTAVVESKSAFGGHFVQEDSRIEFGGDKKIPSLFFRSWYGFDKESKKWITCTLSNMGTCEKSEVFWIDDKMVSGDVSVQEGKPVFQRWITTFGDDANSYTVAGHEASGTGRPFVHVKGTFKRVQVQPAAFKTGREKSPGFAPATAEMSRVAKWTGTYRFTGWMIPMPGAPKIDLAATETFRPIFGGTVLEFELKGDPTPQFGDFEAYGALAWNADGKCYKNLWVDSMGTLMIEDARFVGNDLVSGGATMMMGTPTYGRSVLTFGSDGSLATIDEHRMFGAGAPVHSFHGSYKKQ